MANVLVIPRFRPLNKRELSETNGSEVVVEFEEDHKGMIIKESEEKKHRFTFDWVFPPTCTQAEVYHQVAEPLLVDVFNGFNTTVFAYGQTGSGKSHSMTGKMNDPELRGIIPRMVDGIFQRIQESVDSGKPIEFTVKASFVEIYNEQIRDLCDTRKDKLRLRESPTGVWIEDVTETYVVSHNEVFDIMEKGNGNRAISATNMNSESSRSHSVFIITVGQRDVNTGAKKGSKLTLVDLAGSEKVGKTGAEGATLKEAQHINKSLSALGNVINALTSQPAGKAPGKTVHIPYRDSKLTYLLSDSLGGNSKTLLIITGSPSRFNVEETLSTIRFGNRAKNIKNKPKANQERTAAEYRQLLLAADAAIEKQKAMLADITRAAGAYAASISFLAPSAFAARPIAAQYIERVAKKALELGGNKAWLDLVPASGTITSTETEVEADVDSSLSSLNISTSAPAATKVSLPVSAAGSALDEEASPWGNDDDGEKEPETPIFSPVPSSASVTAPTSRTASDPGLDSALLTDVLSEFGAVPAFADIIATSVSQRDSLFSLASASKEMVEKATALEEGLRASETLLEGLREDLSQARSLATKEAADMAVLSEKLSAAGDALTVATAARDRLLADLEDNQELIAQLKKQNEATEQRRLTTMRDLKLEIEQVSNDRDEALERIQVLSGQVSVLNVSLVEMTVQKDNVSADLVEGKAKIEELEEEIKAYQTQQVEWIQQKSLLDGRISELSAKLSIFEFARAQEQDGSSDGELDTEEHKSGDENDDDDGSDPALSAAKSITKKALQDNRKLEAQFKQKISSMEKQFESTLHNVSETHQTELGDLRVDYTKKIADLDAKHKAAFDEMNAKKTAELQELKALHSSSSSTTSTEIEELENMCEGLIAQKQSHFKALSVTKYTIHSLEEELSAANAKLSESIELNNKVVSAVRLECEREKLQLRQQFETEKAKYAKKVKQSFKLVEQIYSYAKFWRSQHRYHVEPASSMAKSSTVAGYSQANQKVSIKPKTSSHSGGGRINPKFDPSPMSPLTPSNSVPVTKPMFGAKPLDKSSSKPIPTIGGVKSGAKRDGGGLSSFF